MDISPLIAAIPVALAAAFIIRAVINVRDGKSRLTAGIRAAVPAILVLMLAIAVIGFFDGSDEAQDGEYELYDCVPSSQFGSSIDSVKGSAELVTIGNDEYLRMTRLGGFTVTADGSETSYSVGKAHMDLVLLTGQSNSVVYTSPQYYPDESPVAPGKAFYLGNAYDDVSAWTNLATSGTIGRSEIRDLVSPDGSVMVSQMYPAFCSGYVAETGHRVLVVNTGIGGMEISAWNDGGACDEWMYSVFARLSDLVGDGSVSLTPTVALWSQGEADSRNSEAYYQLMFSKLVDRIEDGEWGYSFPKVLTCLPRYPGMSGMTNPAKAQTAVASVDPTVLIASSLPCEFPASADEETRDGIHYTQEVYGWLGEAFARSAAEAMGEDPETETIVYVKPLEVSALPPTVTAYGTSGHAYVLEAHWSAASDPGTYTATLSGNPVGTAIMEGLTVMATVA